TAYAVSPRRQRHSHRRARRDPPTARIHSRELYFVMTSFQYLVELCAITSASILLIAGTTEHLTRAIDERPVFLRRHSVLEAVYRTRILRRTASLFLVSMLLWWCSAFLWRMNLVFEATAISVGWVFAVGLSVVRLTVPRRLRASN